MKNQLSQKITELRKQKGWSQKETAAKLGVSQAVLSHYEKGIRECGLDFLVKLSELYNCSTDYLLGLSQSSSVSSTPDPDNITADLQEYPSLLKSREEVCDTLNIFACLFFCAEKTPEIHGFHVLRPDGIHCRNVDEIPFFRYTV